MTRLCIIGNSHVAALKGGAEALAKRHPDLQLGFFAARSNKTGGLSPVAGRYVPATEDLAAQLALTSGGQREIDPAEWDAFLIYGFGGRPRAGDFAAGLSRSFRREIFTDRIARSLLPRHLANLRSLSDAPIFAALAPLPALAPQTKRTRLLRHPEEIALLQERFCAPLGAQMIPQPEATSRDGLATLPKFSSEAERLRDTATPSARAHRKEDRQHMNARYGALWLEAFVPLLHAALTAGAERVISDAPKVLIRRALKLRQQPG